MNQKLLSRLKGLQGAATSAGPKALYEWSTLFEGSAIDEVTYADVRDFEVRLKKMPRMNNLDKTLDPDSRRLVLPEPIQPSPKLKATIYDSVQLAVLVWRELQSRGSLPKN